MLAYLTYRWGPIKAKKKKKKKRKKGDPSAIIRITSNIKKLNGPPVILGREILLGPFIANQPGSNGTNKSQLSI